MQSIALRACTRGCVGRYSRANLFLAALLPSLLVWSGADAQTAGGRSRPLVTQAINENARVTLAGNTRPEARVAANDQGAVPDNMPLAHMMLQLQRPAEQEAALNALIDQLHDRNSPNFHHWLTAAEIGQQFGPAAPDIQAVTGWLSANGFTVNTVYTNNMVIDFSGTASQVRSAFRTEIHNLQVNGVAHYANVSDPQIPAALAPVVVGVVSMHDFSPVSQAGRSSSAGAPGPNYSEGGQFYNVTPGDLATIYNFKPVFARGNYGIGQTIYLVENSDLYSTADWVTFRNIFGLPNNLGNNLSSEFPAPPSGPTNCTDPGVNGSDLEAIIDAEYASAGAPGANIVMAVCAEAATSGILIAIQNLVNGANPPAIISNSYGECEVKAGATMNAAISTAYQTGVAEGISIYVASGDQGTAGCTPDGNDTNINTVNTGIGVNGFASTAYNVAVGGTDFWDTYLSINSTYWNAVNNPDESSAKSYITEVPWNDTCGNTWYAAYNGYNNPYGSDGFCNSTFVVTNHQGLLNNVAGSGGPSGCATGAYSVQYVVSGTCAGRAKPSWQSLFGVPNDGVRDLPDVSLFAASGPWNHAYLICFSDPARNVSPHVQCSASNQSTWNVGFYYGTSFAAPIWAGIQALLNDANAGRQGNPNYRLYQIANAEYGSSGAGTPPCLSWQGSGVLPAANCVFYDVNEGGNSVPCVPYSGGNLYNCYRPSGTYGVMSTDNNSYKPAYFTGPGYDLSTGIGTVNVANLLNAWSPKSSHDFTEDGRSDILWRDASGDAAIWKMSGGTILGGVSLGNVPANWSFAGSRDFDGDGVSDILWRNTAGDVWVWLMNYNGGRSQASVIGNVPTAWSVVGTGDFNADGKGDILWHDTSGNLKIWFMNGFAVSEVAITNVPTVWSVAGVGDFNGDGKSDILWHDIYGDVSIWEMSGATILAGAGLGNIPTNWSIVGTGDFDGDGCSDILWRDTAGDVMIQLINNAKLLQQSVLGNVPTTWNIAETGDFNGDSHSDILWLDSSGNVMIWFMNGLAASAVNFGNVGTPWSIQGANAD